MTEWYFEVKSVLGKTIRTTTEYWEIIIRFKHPIMRKYEKEAKEALSDSDEVRVSRKDGSVYLYYRKTNKYYVCVLAKHTNNEGFIITAYLADKIKRGEIVWRKRS
jgi:hypothetical protein